MSGTRQQLFRRLLVNSDGKRMELPIMQRRHFKQTNTLEERLEDRAERLRVEARGIPSLVERDRLIWLAKQAETAARLNKWLTSPGLVSPK